MEVQRWLRIHEVFHPTDCSPGSEVALRHAMRIALVTGARLTLMRVGPADGVPSDDLPDVRGIAASWSARASGGEPVPELRVRWHVARGDNPVKACRQSLERNPADLIVVATHPCEGKMTWLGETVAEPLARSAGEMTLLVPEGSPGFVRAEDGTASLRSILIPVARQPAAEPAIEAARRLMLYLPQAEGTATVLHVGDPCEAPAVRLPEVPGWKYSRVERPGDVVDTILRTAEEVAADLVVMTTQGRQGFLDALRGSSTERVLRQAHCPMLTMPVGSFLG
jgi:nucleotide-binding universal stress UspA family protein